MKGKERKRVRESDDRRDGSKGKEGEIKKRERTESKLHEKKKKNRGKRS